MTRLLGLWSGVKNSRRVDLRSLAPIQEGKNVEAHVAAATRSKRTSATEEIMLAIWGEDMWMDALDTQYAQVKENVLEQLQ